MGQSSQVCAQAKKSWVCQDLNHQPPNLIRDTLNHRTTVSCWNCNSFQCVFQDREQSVATVFKTEAVPVMRSRDKTNFHVGYLFDIAKGVNDLNKVVIKFPKKIIEHASCIKHLEVSGRINTAPSGNPAQQQQQSVATADSKVLDMMYPSHDHSHGWHGRANFNQSGTRDLIHKTS